jgi:hypothetical protein
MEQRVGVLEWCSYGEVPQRVRGGSILYEGRRKRGDEADEADSWSVEEEERLQS